MDTVSDNQIKSKRKVGYIGDRPVIEAVTKGGWNMIITAGKDGKLKTLGVGSHRCLSRHIASQSNDITWLELSKADPVDVRDFAIHLPKYEAITKQIQEAEAARG